MTNKNDANEIAIPYSIITTLSSDYIGGFRFDSTALRLLSHKASVEVDNRMQSALKCIMFSRNDGVYFLFNTVVDTQTQKDIFNSANELLSEYGCFEVSELYSFYSERLNPKCIRGVDDFENLLEQMNPCGVRCVAAPYIGNRIARFNNGNVWDLFATIAHKIIDVTNDEFGGVINEDDLHTRFCAFSLDLLSKIIKHLAKEELLRTEINGIVCFQTLDALGLPNDFTDTLAKALERIDELSLTPSEEVLHTALSLALGVNFKAEYNLPDRATYRRLIAVYYKAKPPREWKGGIFSEVLA